MTRVSAEIPVNLWKIELSRKANRDFCRLDRRGRESAGEVVEDPEETSPPIHGAIELRNNPGLWRSERKYPNSFPGLFPGTLK